LTANRDAHALDRRSPSRAIGARPDPPALRSAGDLAQNGSLRPPGPRALIIVENACIPGDRRVWHEAVSLRRGGWNVTVLAPHAGAKRLRPTDEVIEGIQIRRFGLRFAEENRSGHVGEYALAMWRIWREVPRLALDRPFDVIQACNPPDFLLLGALGQRRRGARLIFDHHDLVPELYACRAGRSNLVARALRSFERAAFSFADVALVTNDSIRCLALGRAHKSPEDVFIVRNGPMLERFRPVPRDPTLARGREHLLVYVGVMGRQDGVDHALRALGRLLKRRQDWHARFLGDGEMLPRLRDLASELRLNDHVEFCGFASDEEVRRAICSADVCLAPDPKNSYTDHSTLVKIAEYMALARPTVSYDLTESRATAGDAAVFASNNDPSEFAVRISELLDDPGRRQQLGAAGRARVERELAWEYSERALLAAYRRAVTKRSMLTAEPSMPDVSYAWRAVRSLLPGSLSWPLLVMGSRGVWSHLRW
jgi:glycosyltransferase involved in cell wall biosynthesis